MKRYWKHFSVVPSVDIFLPICGEETEVLKKTFLAVEQLNYARKTVYVLDDKGDPEHELLTKQSNFFYLSRENKGQMEKAGNIKYGYERSNGDYIVILDADFAPHPNFINHLLPYMNDPKVAIVQSPQYFQTDKAVHARSALEYGAAHVQQDFYRLIQVARSQLGAPICCGSNAIYRRAALDIVGGTTQIEHSEDMHTGFDLTNKGWRVKYVPIVLAVGICPTNLHQYFHQQHRWCSGSLSLMFDKKFWLSKQLTFGQKMCFVSGFMYYLSYPLTIIVSFQGFFVLFRHSSEITFGDSIPFLPCLIFSFLIMPIFRIGSPRIGNFLARTANGYAYCHAVVTAFIKRAVDWQPTNAKKLKISKDFRNLVVFNAIYLLVYIAFVGVVIRKEQFQIFNLNYFSILFWIIFNIIANSLMLFKFYLVLDDAKRGQPYITLWRVQTAGLYMFSILGVLVFTIYYGIL
jgi:cellulose synthase (UDP-forming)